MKRFKNGNHKIQCILEAMPDGKKVSIHQILQNLKTQGYYISRQELAMFIRNRMLFRYVKAEKTKNGTLLYKKN